MKKLGMVILLILLFIIIYLLQANFFAWFNLAGVKPNLFIILVLTIGLFAGKKVGIISGVLLGIVLDFIISKSIGISAIMFGTIGIIGGYLDKSFSKDSRITIVTMVVIATFIYEIGIIILNSLINQAHIGIGYIIKTLFIEVIYNGIITIIIYPLILKIGYVIEENFNRNKILTKYF